MAFREEKKLVIVWFRPSSMQRVRTSWWDRNKFEASISNSEWSFSPFTTASEPPACSNSTPGIIQLAYHPIESSWLDWLGLRDENISILDRNLRLLTRGKARGHKASFSRFIGGQLEQDEGHEYFSHSICQGLGIKRNEELWREHLWLVKRMHNQDAQNKPLGLYNGL